MVASLSCFLDPIRRRIAEACRKSGRPIDSVRLIAVSKTHGSDKILQALESGQEEFGENYVQEWKRKKQTLEAEASTRAARIRWHVIGHLQTNKVKDVVGHAEWIHTIDSLRLARKISEEASRRGVLQKALLEVKLAPEENKSGWLPLELLEALPELGTLPSLDLRGLMTIPPAAQESEQTRPYFASLKSLLDECNESGFCKEPMRELSMGMSEDFEVAIEEGATMVRVGRAIFGARE